MKLYGSTTSPYVRRLRYWLADRPYEFVNMDIFGPEGRKQLKAKNPTLKIPMLEDEGQIIFDSNVIFRYLNQKFGNAPLSWEQENQLTLINAANDSLVELLLCNRSNLDTKSDTLFFKLQHERVGEVFAELNRQLDAGALSDWNYVTLSLYSLLDWCLFRHLFPLDHYPALRAFHKAHQQDPWAIKTDPR